MRMQPNPAFSAFPDSPHHAEHEDTYSCLDACCVPTNKPTPEVATFERLTKACLDLLPDMPSGNEPAGQDMGTTMRQHRIREWRKAVVAATREWAEVIPHDWAFARGATLDMDPPIRPVVCRRCGETGTRQDWPSGVVYSNTEPCRAEKVGSDVR